MKGKMEKKIGIKNNAEKGANKPSSREPFQQGPFRRWWASSQQLWEAFLMIWGELFSFRKNADVIRRCVITAKSNGLT